VQKHPLLAKEIVMPSAIHSDGQIISVIENSESMAEASRQLGINVSALYKRRKRIESKVKEPLKGPNDNHQMKTRLEATTHPKAQNLGILNGTVIVFSDAHFWPGIHTTAYRGLLWAIKELQPKAVIANGDIFDGAGISRHPRIGWAKAPTVMQELKACTLAMGEIEEAAKKARHNVKLIWPLGNHDARFETFLAANAPQYEHVKGFSLRDHFPDWEPCWSVWLNDSTVVKHRFKGGIHATHNNTMWSGKNIITGHLHSLKVTPFTDYNGVRYGIDTGTLAEPYGPQFEDYTEQGPLNWRSGFAVLTFSNGKLLLPELATTHGPDSLEFRGRVIDVN
jgi:metallophosphoesterase superfamily enzyme